jgi:hypothetical protein
LVLLAIVDDFWRLRIIECTGFEEMFGSKFMYVKKVSGYGGGSFFLLTIMTDISRPSSW